MPYQWNAERERRMLLLAISSANLRPSADTWKKVAALLGEGLTPSAVRSANPETGFLAQEIDLFGSQKYYKLRNESAKLFEGQPGSTPSTPTKRKASDDEDEKKTPPSKRSRKPKRDPLDGVPLSDISDISSEVKDEDLTINAIDPFASYNQHFMPTGFFMPVNVPFKDEPSGSNSFVG